MSHSNIAFDARMWDHPGIGRYIRELVYALAKEERACELCLIGGKGFLNGARHPRCLAPFPPFAFKNARAGIYSLSEQWEVPWRARGLDLLHVPHFNIPVLWNKKLVVTIHDLIYVHDASASKSPLGRAYARFLFNQIAKKADAILAVSEYTKMDLLQTFPKIPPDRVFVTYEAASPHFKVIEDRALLEETKARYGLRGSFVLFIGTLKRHKNIPILIEAMKQLRDARSIEQELVIVGRPDARNKELLKLISNQPFVRYLSSVVDQEDMISLYNLADLFVLPSLREGFGLPVLEAMACGTPVAVSKTSSLPEVAGQAGAFFDPGRVDALADVIYTVLSDKDLRIRMARQGLERSKLFSWSATAKKTMDVYARVLHE